MRTNPSAPPAASIEPSALNDTANTGLGDPLTFAFNSPVRASQIHTVPSPEPVANKPPPGLSAPASTAPVCRGSVLRSKNPDSLHRSLPGCAVLAEKGMGAVTVAPPTLYHFSIKRPSS